MSRQNKANAKVVVHRQPEARRDGKTPGPSDGKNIKANGETSNDRAVYERLSGGPL
jgi:hypothetical protein